MKSVAILVMLLFCLPVALASNEDSKSVEATTAITLPVDSVTIYPDGLMAVNMKGRLDVTEGVHKFVINLPEKAEKSTVLLSVKNASQEMVVYEDNPVFTLNVSSAGVQDFALSYLMYNAASWSTMYDLHIENDSVLVNANAAISNFAGEDLKDVRLKLVAGLPLNEPYSPARSSIQNQLYAAPVAAAAPSEEYMDYAAEAAPTSTGELETMYIFELKDRADLAIDKEIGFPLFEEEAQLVRTYTWNAYNEPKGPVREEIRANNTLSNPWPSGSAMLYRDEDYVSTIEMPYTPAGTNASIEIGPSADIKVESKLRDYNITENLKVIGSEGGNHTIRETVESWTYNLLIKSNLDRTANLEASDSIPQEAVVTSVSLPPAESTATNLKWKVALAPRQKTAINYTYEVTTTKSLDSEYY
jgi:hypothetical protein